METTLRYKSLAYKLYSGNVVRLLRRFIHPWRYNTIGKIKNYGLAKFQKWRKTSKLRSKPYRYSIDPINICNLKCPVCPTGLGILGREQGKIEFNNFVKIIEQIKDTAIGLELYNWGEPFLHPDIFKMISYAHNCYISVGLNTNLNYFNAKMAQQTVNANLDRLVVSIDGSTQEVYEKYRKNGKLNKVLNNVRLLVAEKEKQDSIYPFITIRLLVTRHNEHQIDEMRQLAKDLKVDKFTTHTFFVDTTNVKQVKEWLPTNQAYSDYDYTGTPENVWHCSDLWERMVINWDGNVAPCCWLHHKSHDFENILEKPLDDIWNGDAYISSRGVFALDETKKDTKKTICATCKGKPLHLKY